MAVIGKRVAWLVWTVQLLVALVAVSVLNGRAATTSRPGGSASVARYGFRLEQVNARAGIDFTHEAPTFDSRLEQFDLTLDTAVAARGLIIRAYDAKNNSATARGDAATSSR